MCDAPLRADAALGRMSMPALGHLDSLPFCTSVLHSLLGAGPQAHPRKSVRPSLCPPASWHKCACHRGLVAGMGPHHEAISQALTVRLKRPPERQALRGTITGTVVTCRCDRSNCGQGWLGRLLAKG